MSYTSITIGGVSAFIDPDTMGAGTENIISVDRSLAGTSYVTSINTNSPAVKGTANLSGVYLPEANVTALWALSKQKTAVKIAGGIIGFSGSYIIMSMQHSPIKPLVVFPEDSSIKYQYSISLQEVD